MCLPDTDVHDVDTPVQGGDTGVPTGGDTTDATGGDTGVPLNQNQSEPEPIELDVKRTRARQLPDDFIVGDDLLAWAKANHPSIDTTSETKQFGDYHRARGSTMKDWAAAWRTWIRNAEKFQKTGTNGQPTGYRNSSEWTDEELGVGQT